MFTKLAIGSALAVALTMAPLAALAHDDAQANANISGNMGFHLGSFISAHTGLHTDADADDNNSGTVQEDSSTTRAHASGIVAAGSVTSTSASGFTLADLFGLGSTNVSTDASTTFVGRGHQATTSAALTAGQKVLVFGQNIGGTIEATFVKILGGLGHHMGAWLHLDASAHAN